MVYEIELPWFDKILMPNYKKAGWREKAEARKVQKELAYYTIKTKPPVAEEYNLEIIFCQPDNRRDLDGCISSIKGYLDGVALAWQVNDKQFKKITSSFGETKKPGKIIIKVL